MRDDKYLIRIEGFSDLDVRGYKPLTFFGSRIPQIIGEIFFSAGEVQRYAIQYSAVSANGDSITIVLPMARMDTNRCRYAEERILNSMRSMDRTRPTIHFTHQMTDSTDS